MNNTATVSAQDVKKSQVTSMGGNKYHVTIGKAEEVIDLDGFTVMSNEDYAEVERAGLTTDDMICPSQWDLKEDGYFFKEALDTAANYSGFSAEEYIEEMK